MAAEASSAISASEAAAEIARGALSAEDYARACLDRVEAVEDVVRAFAHLDPAHVLAQARSLDDRRRRGLPTGPLHGVPVAVKDIIDTADYATENGSPLFAGRRPRRDATAVGRLRAAGAVIFGKTVTTELAFYHPGPTRNPHDPERTPGGSSSGSAAAVAAGMVPLALGTQTNGSVIRPAAFCGVFGIKPSHGLVSRAGVLMHSRRLDHVGAFARTLPDLALILDVIAGHDPEDPDTRAIAAPAYRAAAAEGPPLPPRIAFVRTPIWDRLEAAAKAEFEALAARLGDAVEAVELPERFTDAWEAQRAVMAADMAHAHGARVERGGDIASETLRAFLADGRAVPAVRYLAALAEARVLNAALDEIFNAYDAILTPATTGVAPKGLEATGDPAFCTVWTLLGVPALSLPLLESAGLPLGVQLVGAMGDDARLMRTAAWLIRAATGQPSHRRRARSRR